jgi:small subunit ribosomal protein S20
MANNAAARKRIRVNLRKALRNRSDRSAVKTYVIKFRRLADGGDAAQAQEQARTAVAALDRAASKGVLHPNNAARRKSRLMRRLAQVNAGVAPEKPSKGSGKPKSTRRAGSKSGAKSSSKSQ